jgi:hypothetical protein
MKSEKTDPEKLVEWRTFPGRLYAEMVAEVLKKEQIHCIIKGDDAGILGASSVAEYSPGTASQSIRQAESQFGFWKRTGSEPNRSHSTCWIIYKRS